MDDHLEQTSRVNTMLIYRLYLLISRLIESHHGELIMLYNVHIVPIHLGVYYPRYPLRYSSTPWESLCFGQTSSSLYISPL